MQAGIVSEGVVTDRADFGDQDVQPFREPVDGESRLFRMPVTQTWVRTPEGWTCLAGHVGPAL